MANMKSNITFDPAKQTWTIPHPRDHHPVPVEQVIVLATIARPGFVRGEILQSHGVCAEETQNLRAGDLKALGIGAFKRVGGLTGSTTRVRLEAGNPNPQVC